MKLMKTLCVALVGMLLSQAILAADLKISALPGASGMSSTDLTLCDQGGVTRICTGAQVAAMVQANLPNTTGSGNVVLSVSPSLVTPSLGAASAISLSLSGGLTTNVTGLTQCVHVNSAGLLSGTGVDCGVGGGGGSSAFSSITSGTNTSGTMVVGSGASLAASGTGTITATTLASITGLPSIGNQTIIGNGSGTNAAPIALTLSGNLAATPTGITTRQNINPQTGTSYTIAASDAGSLITFNNAGAVAVTLPVATATGFTAGFSFDVHNKGAGTITITPTTSTVNGATTLSIPQNDDCTVTSDGANYQVSACTALVTGGGGGSSAFNAITSGTNTSSAMVVGSGATLSVSGTGTIGATSLSAYSGLPNISTQTVLGNGTGSNAAPAALTLGGNLVATSSTLGTSQSINAQSGTSYTLQASDAGKLVSSNNAASVAWALPQAGTTGFTSGYSFDAQNKGAGVVTITPTTSTINGASTLTINQGRGCQITSDGTNYQVSNCNALISTSGSGTVTSVAATVPTGFTISGSPVTTSGTLAIGFSGLVVGGTKFTIAGTGCTPSATTGGATAGTFTLASGPCTAVTITMNGATGLTAPTGWFCSASDNTTTNAGTFIPVWGVKSSTTTTATLPIPAAAGATDVIGFSCTGY